MNISNGFTLFHAIIFGILAIFHVWVWVRRGFHLPRYVHVLAALAAAIGGGVIWFLQQPQYQTTPSSTSSPTRYLMVLLFPAIVYGVFVLYGGAAAAPDPKLKPHRGKEEPAQARHPLQQSQPFDSSADDRTRR